MGCEEKAWDKFSVILMDGLKGMIGMIGIGRTTSLFIPSKLLSPSIL